jgi:hypothetical protein
MSLLKLFFLICLMNISWGLCASEPTPVAPALPPIPATYLKEQALLAILNERAEKFGITFESFPVDQRTCPTCHKRNPAISPSRRGSLQKRTGLEDYLILNCLQISGGTPGHDKESRAKKRIDEPSQDYLEAMAEAVQERINKDY